MKTFVKILILAILAIGLCTVLACPSGTSATTYPNATSADKPRMASFSPGQVGPFVIPASWKQATWFVDGSNSSGCASDNNRTCSSSSCTSGDGPCLTYGSIVTRWGTYQPRLRQNTTITFMSSQAAGDGDPVYLQPYFENQASMFVTGTPTVAATGTLGVVTPKNRSSPQLLNAVLTPGTGAIAVQQMLIVTGAHAGEAWVYKDVSGTTWSLSQPLAPAQTTAVGTGVLFSTIAAEQDSFTMGDAYTTVTFPNVQLADVEPFTESWSGAPNFAGGAVYISNIAVSSSGFGTNAPLVLGTGVLLADVLSQRMIAGTAATRSSISQGSSNFGYSQETYNTWMNGGNWPTGQFVSQTLSAGTSFFVAGGVVAGGEQVRLGNMTFNQDTIMGACAHGGCFANNAVVQSNGLYIDAGSAFIVNSGNVQVNAFLWGPGSVILSNNSRLQYPPGATGAVTNLIYTGGTTLNGQTKVCSSPPSDAGPPACNITFSAAQSDTSLGVVSGCLFVPGGASVCNN